MRPLEGVRDLRERRMLSQQELADSAGVSLFTVQRIERGEGSVRPKTGRAIAAALDVGVEDLLGKAQPPLPDFEDGAKDEGFDSTARSYRLPMPQDLEQRRRYAEHLMETGVSESTACGVSGVNHRPEEYWRALEKLVGSEGDFNNERRDPNLLGVAVDLLAFGYHLLRTWEAELPDRAQADDDEWLGTIAATWLIFGKINYGVLKALSAEGLADKQDWLEQYMARYMDLNAAVYRINAAIQEHIEADAATRGEAVVGLEPLIAE